MTRSPAAAPMDPGLHAAAIAAPGFLDDDEGLRLYALARDHAALGPLVEIGSYCGKSSVYLAAGARAGSGRLVCVDHHRGSEEHQPGEGYHDPALFDASVGRMDTLPTLRRVLYGAGLEDVAILVVASSPAAAAVVGDGLGMVFIDGGHSFAAATVDYEAWHGKLAAGGVLAIHDLFPDPAAGGQAPITIYRRALASGRFEELPTTKTLGVLRRR
jgi:predicted O-methyltransferase YrrM